MRVNTTAQQDKQTSWIALIDHIDALLASPPVYPCLLLVHPSISILNTTAQRLVDHYAWAVLSLGTVLSEALLAISARQRPGQVRSAINQAIHHTRPEPILCTDLDLLFEPTLKLDPLRLLRDWSRQTPLVAMWPGQYDGRTLSYAVPEHGHYRTWPRPDLCDRCILVL